MKSALIYLLLSSWLLGSSVRAESPPLPDTLPEAFLQQLPMLLELSEQQLSILLTTAESTNSNQEENRHE